MGRLMAVDYGLKRIGLAVTDPNQIIASPLQTVLTPVIFSFLKAYFSKEKVDLIIVGLPQHLDGKDTDATEPVREFIKQLHSKFPYIKTEPHDERFTSKIAAEAILRGGVKKKNRQDKSLTDKVSAAIILQSYLESRELNNSKL